MRLLFIGGTDRSGSTLVERILNELPGLCGLGEVARVWQNGLRDDRLCACGSRFSECPLWSGIGERAFGGWHNVDRDRLRALHDAVVRTGNILRFAGPTLSAPWRERVAEYVDYYTRIYAAASALTGAQVIVDSSKHAALAFCLRRTSDIDLRVLHLVRDPRGVAHSWTKRVYDPETGGTLPVPRYPVARCALSWNAHNAAFGLLARTGDRAGRPDAGRLVLRMRYEEFLADAPAAVDTIARFAGLDGAGVDASFLGSHHADLGVLHSVSGNRMRFTTGRLALGVDDAWRTALPPSRRGLVGVLCAPLLLAYGYWRQAGPPSSLPRSGSTGEPDPAAVRRVQGEVRQR